MYITLKTADGREGVCFKITDYSLVGFALRFKIRPQDDWIHVRRSSGMFKIRIGRRVVDIGDTSLSMKPDKSCTLLTIGEVDMLVKYWTKEYLQT